MTTSSRTHEVTTPPMASLLNGVKVVSIGVADFADALWCQQVPCVHVDWTPAGSEHEDPELRALLDRLL